MSSWIIAILLLFLVLYANATKLFFSPSCHNIFCFFFSICHEMTSSPVITGKLYISVFKPPFYPKTRFEIRITKVKISVLMLQNNKPNPPHSPNSIAAHNVITTVGHASESEDEPPLYIISWVLVGHEKSSTTTPPPSPLPTLIGPNPVSYTHLTLPTKRIV